MLRHEYVSLKAECCQGWGKEGGFLDSLLRKRVPGGMLLL